MKCFPQLDKKKPWWRLDLLFSLKKKPMNTQLLYTQTPSCQLNPNSGKHTTCKLQPDIWVLRNAEIHYVDVDRPQLASKHSWFFFFWHLLLHPHYIHKAGTDRGDLLQACQHWSWSLQQLPIPAFAPLFRAPSSMYNNPAKCTTGPQTATRGMTHVKTATTFTAWLCYNTAAAPRNKRVFSSSTDMYYNHRYNDLYTMTQFLLKLRWWWCCCQHSPMYMYIM